MKEHKENLIKHYIKTKLNLMPDREQLLFERIAPMFTIQSALKLQDLESPGPASEGRVWYSAQAMVHGYYYSKKKDAIYGTQIWKKKEAILFASSLLNGTDRTNYVQMLEDGIVTSISYPDMLTIRSEFPEVSADIEQTILQNEQAHQHRIQLLNEPSLDRIMRFEKENPLFCSITNLDIKAMHVGLKRKRYGYIRRQV
ncbi:hypothetical protein KO02_16185 [Sphingobacterium sp. ML3W]|uniref:hypothetical protein n=1 Tax=Sphingobacterium sp. ML3W TaxID=1538644 RepID=UPI0004F65B71|nr:hypothetical protein [Sphingobacterium sp. ML3W]AIM38051.1 hypothetical protein KO02_16185 [Sphingobacterium sp. ML3W]